MRAILFSVLIVATAAQAQDLVFRNATVYTITGGIIANGAVRISDGRNHSRGVG